MDPDWDDRVNDFSYLQHSLCKTLPDNVNNMIASKEPSIPSFIKKSESVLEIGCGKGRWSKHLCDREKYVGIDISGEAIKFCESHYSGEFKIMDATKLPFDNNSFDIVFWSNILPGLNKENRLKMYNEVQRIAKHKIIFLEFVMFWPFSMFVKSPLKHKELMTNLSGTFSLCDLNRVIKLRVFWLLYGSMAIMKLTKNEKFLYSVLHMLNMVDQYMPSAYRIYIFDRVAFYGL